jgi:hypothetical protein
VSCFYRRDDKVTGFCKALKSCRVVGKILFTDIDFDGNLPYGSYANVYKAVIIANNLLGGFGERLIRVKVPHCGMSI